MPQETVRISSVKSSFLHTAGIQSVESTPSPSEERKIQKLIEGTDNRVFKEMTRRSFTTEYMARFSYQNSTASFVLQV